jgi:hypothetical protein
MASGTILGAIEIVVGIIAFIIPGGQGIGVALIVGGLGMVAASLLSPSPPEPLDRLKQRRQPGIDARVNSPDRPLPVCLGRTIILAPPLIWGPEIKDVYSIVPEGYQTPGKIRFKAAYGLCQGPIAAVEKVMTSDGIDLKEMVTKTGGADSRYGLQHQTSIIDMQKQVNYTPVAIDIEKYNANADTSLGEPDNTVTISTTQEIENFSLIFSNPSGLYFKETAETRLGNPGPKECLMDVWYKKVSDPSDDHVQVTDETVGIGNGTKKVFYLPSASNANVPGQDINILGPAGVVPYTLLVKRNGVTIADFTTVTLNYNGTTVTVNTVTLTIASGKLTFNTAVSNGAVITATYQYPVDRWHPINHDQGRWPETQMVRSVYNNPNGSFDSSIDGVETSVTTRNFLWGWGGVMIVPVRRQFEGAVVRKVTEKTYRRTRSVNTRGLPVTSDTLLKSDTFNEHLPKKLPRDFYHIRIRNKTPTIYTDDVDDVQLIGIEQITYEDNLEYPWTALYFLRSYATDNLERNLTNMNFIVHGSKMVDIDDYYTNAVSDRVYTDNCANLVAYLLTDPIVGLGLSLSDLDQDSFLQFYDYCNESLEFGEWKVYNFSATGNASTEYVIDDFNISSQVDYVRVYNGTIFNNIGSEDWIKTANGIKFTGSGEGGTVDQGQVPQFNNQVSVRYRTNILRGSMSATFDTKTTYEEAIAALLEPLNSFLYQAGGKIAIAIDRDETPGTATFPTAVLELDVQNSSMVLVDGDGAAISDKMKTSIKISANPRKLKANRIKLKYLNGQNNFKDDLVIVEDSLSIATFGLVVLEKTVQTVATRRQAEEAAKYMLRNLSVDDVAIQISTPPIGQSILPGDIVAVRDTNRAWNPLTCRVTNVKLHSLGRGMGAELTLIPYNEQKYTASVVSGITRRSRSGLSSQGSLNNASLVTSSAKDVSFSIVK